MAIQSLRETLEKMGYAVLVRETEDDDCINYSFILFKAKQVSPSVSFTVSGDTIFGFKVINSTVIEIKEVCDVLIQWQEQCSN